MKAIRAIISGGGTGGHVYPALALAQALIARHDEVLYVGTSQGMESRLIPREGIPFAAVSVEGWPRKLSLAIFRAGYKLGRGLIEAQRLLAHWRPQIVIGTGGYVCGPVVMAAAISGVPIVLHEQNALPGVTNRQLARWAKKVCLTFKEAAAYLPERIPTVVTGLPVRQSIISMDRLTGASQLGVDPGKFLLLVAGGSQGARSINRSMLGVYHYLAGKPDFQVFHITGQSGYEETINGLRQAGIGLVNSGNITIKPYLYEIEAALAAADLVVCRAGASFLAEIAVRGLPAVIIPYPHATDNHQEKNARAMEAAGAAEVILDRDLNGSSLQTAVERLWRDTPRRQAMADSSRRLGRPDALERILEVVTTVAAT